jgi:hypothetical protein
MSITQTYQELSETVMTNSDHTIENEVAEKLKTGKYFSQYSGWNFCGYVWWNKDKWSCEVWTYHSLSEIVNGSTLEEIMDEVSTKYGYE